MKIFKLILSAKRGTINSFCLFIFIFNLSVFYVKAQTCENNLPSSPAGIVPVQEDFPGGPPVCEGGVRYTPNDGLNETATINLTGNYSVIVTITNTDCGPLVSWTVPAGIVIDKVYVKGGTGGQNVYDYSVVYPRIHSDGSLHSPVNPSGKYAGVSHIDFCYHYQLIVTKTANTTFKRTYNWEIQKSCTGPSALTLANGQLYNYPFTWTASHSHADSDWKVSGVITIANNSPFPATVTSLTDVLSGGESGTISCSLPLTIPSGSSVNCNYSVSVATKYNGINTATVGTGSNLVEGGFGTASFVFGGPTHLIDECIIVDDDCTPSQTICVGNSLELNYSCPITYNTCGQYTYTNTASFTTNDNGETGSDFCTVAVNVPCQTGCTLTQGYWKTHSSYGPAPYDDNWANVGENTPFYLSNKTWYQVLWTAPQGNAYYNLAHQYIAAYLNVLNGASDAAVVNELACAVTLFNTWTPAQVAGMSSTNKTRKKFISVASILDNYNNGLIGPGHCSESQPQAMPATVTVPDQQDFETAETGQTDDRSQAEIGVVTVAPNPAGETVDLRAAGQYSRGHWMITDMGGRVVMTATKDDGVENSTIHVGMLPAGLYSVQFHTANSSLIYQAKMVIIR